MINTLQQPTAHATDLPLGGYAFHGKTPVRIFGREREDKDGPVVKYWVVENEYTKQERRYLVAAKYLRG